MFNMYYIQVRSNNFQGGTVKLNFGNNISKLVDTSVFRKEKVDRM